jgi:hypothetical protein
MSCLRSALLNSAARRLRAAESDLHRVPDLGRLHAAVSAQLVELGPWVPLIMLWRLWLCAFYIERSAHHALQAEGCRR